MGARGRVEGFSFVCGVLSCPKRGRATIVPSARVSSLGFVLGRTRSRILVDRGVFSVKRDMEVTENPLGKFRKRLYCMASGGPVITVEVRYLKCTYMGISGTSVRDIGGGGFRGWLDVRGRSYCKRVYEAVGRFTF